MSKYLEMCQAVRDSRNALHEYRQRSWNNLGAIVDGLTTICGVPDDKVRLLRWNGEYDEFRHFEPPDSGRYTLPGAVVYDPQDEFWYLGLQIWVSQCEWITFAIGVAEIDGSTMFKLGSAKHNAIDLSDEKQKILACEGIADEIIGVYRKGRRGETARKIGFEFSPQRDEGLMKD